MSGRRADVTNERSLALYFVPRTFTSLKEFRGNPRKDSEL